MSQVSIAASSLHRLRRRLLSAGPGVAAEILQDAGFATGEALGAIWSTQLDGAVGARPSWSLPADQFGNQFAALCGQLGWGAVTVESLDDRAVLFTTPDWYEADPGSTEHPGCYFTCGCLAAFLSAQADTALAVLEVECRSSGHDQCRFVVASSEVLSAVYDLVAAGGNWRDTFAG